MISPGSSITAIAASNTLAIRYTERLAEAGVVNSVGSKGDSYDNALAETVNGLYEAELIRRRKRWHSLEELELATAAWVHWWNVLQASQGELELSTGVRSRPCPVMGATC